MKKRGFSLIELIIVIAVISAISAMVIPSLTGVQSSAQSQAAEAAADAMTLAIIKYRLQGGTEGEWDTMTNDAEKYLKIATYLDFPLMKEDDDGKLTTQLSYYKDEYGVTFIMPSNLGEKVITQ